MKRITVLMLAMFAAVLYTVAQDKPLSPPATVEGKIGAANVKITYCQPSARGRKMLGGKEPYGQVWRTGANEATTIEFDKPVKLEGKDVPAEQILFVIVFVCSPLFCFFIKNDGPLVLVRDSEKRVTPCFHCLTAKCNILGKGDLGSLVCAGAPNLAILFQSTEYFPALLIWAAVSNFYITGFNSFVRTFAVLRAGGKYKKSCKQKKQYMLHGISF